MTLQEKILELQGPILVMGAGGFVGANLYRMLSAVREDVYGTASVINPWRLVDIGPKNLFVGRFDVRVPADTSVPLCDFKTVFNCLAYGGYSWQTDSELIYRTNFDLTCRIVQDLAKADIAAYVHAGSSSEYGDNSAAPLETDFLAANSDYAVSKAAAATYLYYMGQKRSFPCANLRLYSVYGPWEDEKRLIPTVIREGRHGLLPPFVSPTISRDFVYVDDACEAFVDAALCLGIHAYYYGRSFNIGTGVKTTIAEVAALSIKLFGLDILPSYQMPPREWDVTDWYASTETTTAHMLWKATTDFETGLRRTLDWEISRDGKS